MTQDKLLELMANGDRAYINGSLPKPESSHVGHDIFNREYFDATIVEQAYTQGLIQWCGTIGTVSEFRMAH